MESRDVIRAAPIAPYIGGKRNLAKRLVAMIAERPHATYAEPFVGMGGVFFRRLTAPAAEVINDGSRDVATLFRILQRHYVPFLEMLRYQLTTRAEFERLVSVNPATLTDLERAARFLYLQRTTFGGTVARRSFGVSRGRPGRFDVTKLVPMLEDVHARLAGVVIECLPFAAFIDRYDRADTLFYIDPPYWGSEGDYGKELFGRDQFSALADQLSRIKGDFILSLNDCPAVRETFVRFRIEGVTTTYSVGAGSLAAAAEVIITKQ